MPPREERVAAVPDEERRPPAPPSDERAEPKELREEEPPGDSSSISVSDSIGDELREGMEEDGGPLTSTRGEVPSWRWFTIRA